MSKIDVEALLVRVDLRSVIERDLGPAQRKTGAWLFWRCPFHADRGPSFGVKEGHWRCWGACRTGGNVITYVRKRNPALGFREACMQLDQNILDVPVLPRPPAPPPSGDEYKAPTLQWQEAATWLVDRGVRDLFSEAGGKARAWLLARGLTEDTLRKWRIGYNPTKGSIRTFRFVPRGIFIPCWMGGQLWGVHIRLPKTTTGQKYTQLAAGKTALFGADRAQGRRVIVLCEGEFDAMLLDQEANDWAGTISTTGGAGRKWQSEWSHYLALTDLLLVAYDNDEAGKNGQTSMGAISKRARTLPLPFGKDITEFYLAKGDLGNWLNRIRKTLLADGTVPAALEETDARIELLSKCMSEADGDIPFGRLLSDLKADRAEMTEGLWSPK